MGKFYFPGWISKKESKLIKQSRRKKEERRNNMMNKSRERAKCKATNFYVFRVRFSELCSEKCSKEHISNNEIARSIGVTDRNLRRYIEGECVPKADVLITIAKYFNVSIDWLMARDVFEKENYHAE